MRLREFFSIDEATSDLDPRLAADIVRRYDPGVGGILSDKGLQGIVLKGSNNSVWKITDDQREYETARKLVGQYTSTLVPVLRAEELDDPHPGEYRQGHRLYLIQTELMHPLDRANAAAMSAIDDDDVDPGQLKLYKNNIEWAAKKAGMPYEQMLPLAREALAWVREAHREAVRYGIAVPDFFGGEDNVRQDEHGDMRLIDLGSNEYRPRV